MNSSTHQADSLLQPSSELDIKTRVYQRIRGREWGILIALLIISDVVMAAAAFRVSYWIRFETGLPWFETNVLTSRAYYEGLVTIFIPICLVLYTISGLYHRDNLLGGTREYALVFRGTTTGLLLVVLIGFLQPNFLVARGWLLLAWTLVFLYTAAARFTIRRLAYYLRSQGYFLARAMIIGANDEARLLADQLKSWYSSGLNLIGYVTNLDEEICEFGSDLHCLGHLKDLDEIIHRAQVNEIILASSALSREEIFEIFGCYGMTNGINLHMSSGLYEILTTGLTLKEFANVPLVGVNKVRLTGTDRVLKTTLDLVLTIPGLLLISPLLLLIAIMIKLDSPGPVFHLRTVMGVNGNSFDAFKFRTMHQNGDAILESTPELKDELERKQKLKDDPRVTRLGKYLRRFSLDELPQLLNVLRFEMSLVGPRMISPAEMGRYNQWGMNLLTVQPGITGLWQVSGRSDVTYEERVRLDMHYVRNWTIWLDIQLLMRTIPAVLKGIGAY